MKDMAAGSWGKFSLWILVYLSSRVTSREIIMVIRRLIVMVIVRFINRLRCLLAIAEFIT